MMRITKQFEKAVDSANEIALEKRAQVIAITYMAGLDYFSLSFSDKEGYSHCKLTSSLEDMLDEYENNYSYGTDSEQD